MKIVISKETEYKTLIENKEKDFYTACVKNSGYIKLKKDMFCVFFPNELHKPGIVFDTITECSINLVKLGV